jgi:transposase-like protein
VARRKAAVVAAVSSGMITLEEACRRYRMSEEEFFAWRRAFDSNGILGLRATCLHQRRGDHRPPDPPPEPPVPSVIPTETHVGRADQGKEP